MTFDDLTKAQLSQFGRALVMLFNRSMMYQANHPFLNQGVDGFMESAEILFSHMDHVVFILNRDMFFVDDEPMDERVNTSRLVSLFKKNGIQSISFEAGLEKREVQAFIGVLTEISRYDGVDAFRQAAVSRGVTRIRVNHVRYQKVTEDDKVISRDLLAELTPQMDTSGEAMARKTFMDSMLQSILTEEIAKTLNIETLLSNPEEVSRNMIMADLSQAEGSGGAGSGSGGGFGGDGSGGDAGDGPESGPGGGSAMDGGAGGGGGRGVLMLRQMDALRVQMEERGDVSLNALADAVFNMKKQLIEGIESQKALGVAYENETAILEKANTMTDQVLIRLVRDEYKKGKISPSRMAQILRRLVPEADDLKRLLPQIKKALFEEGMSAAQYLDLVREMEKEFQNENLARILRESGEEIGVDGNQLIEAFKQNPEQAAQLIYLASEIRKSTGNDDDTLTEILASYVEQISGQMAMEHTGDKDNPEHLKTVVRSIETGLVNHLSRLDVGDDMIAKLENRLNARMETIMDQMREEWLKSREQSPKQGEAQKRLTILQTLEQSVSPRDPLGEILKVVRAKVDSGAFDENDFKRIQEEIDRQKKLIREREANRSMPAGVVKAGAITFLIEKEIARSLRYDTSFSALAFSMIKVSPRIKVSVSALTNEMLMDGVLSRLSILFRDVDIVGQLGKNTIVAVLPMGTRESSRKTLSRIMTALNENPIEVNAVLMDFRFAGVAMAFDSDETPDAKTFIQSLFRQLQGMSQRLKNIHALS